MQLSWAGADSPGWTCGVLVQEKHVQSWNSTKHENNSKIGITTNMSKVGIIPNMRRMENKPCPKLEFYQTWKQLQSWNYTKHEKQVQNWNSTKHEKHEKKTKSKVGIMPNWKTEISLSPKLEFHQTWKTWKKDKVQNSNFTKLKNRNFSKSKIGISPNMKNMKKRQSPKFEFYQTEKQKFL